MAATKLAMMQRHSGFFLPCTAAFVLAWLGCCSAASAGPHVDIVVGAQAPKLERFAAEELAAQLTRLYEAEAAVVEQAPAGDAPLILIGSPATNPAVKRAASANWPKLSEQGHLLRSIKLNSREVLLVGGGSPQASLWAAYELGHRLGIRYLLSGDVYPAEPGELELAGYDLVLEPALKDRTWVGMGAEPIGMSAWGMDDQKRLLGQLVKLKFNRVVLRFEPWQPFVDFECHGVHKRTAQLWQREDWPIDSETPGRSALHGAKEFSNPDFAGKKDYEAKTKAGIALARGVLQRGRELGMATGIEVTPFAFPREFAQTFASRPAEGSGGLAVGFEEPGRLAVGTPAMKLVVAQLAAYLKTYPEIDAMYLRATKHDQASLAGRDAWFADATTLAKPWEELFAEFGGARHRCGVVRATESAKLKGVRLLEAVVELQRPRHGLDALDTRRGGEDQPPLMSPLIGETPQMLPQANLENLHDLLDRRRDLSGCIVALEHGMPGDLDADLFYLARATFGAKLLTPEAACKELVAPICGPATSERLLIGFRAAERASSLAAKHDPTFGTPSPDVVMKHYNSDSPAPEWWKEAKEGYLTCLTESLRAKDRSLLPGRPWLRFVGKRMEFAYEYMNCIEYVQAAGQARDAGDSEAQLEHLEAAVEAMYNSLRALGEVAEDQSDRGVIAVLAEYGYRPLVKEFEKAEDAAE